MLKLEIIIITPIDYNYSKAQKIPIQMDNVDSIQQNQQPSPQKQSQQNVQISHTKQLFASFQKIQTNNKNGFERAYFDLENKVTPTFKLLKGTYNIQEGPYSSQVQKRSEKDFKVQNFGASIDIKNQKLQNLQRQVVEAPFLSQNIDTRGAKTINEYQNSHKINIFDYNLPSNSLKLNQQQKQNICSPIKITKKDSKKQITDDQNNFQQQEYFLYNQIQNQERIITPIKRQYLQQQIRLQQFDSYNNRSSISLQILLSAEFQRQEKDQLMNESIYKQKSISYSKIDYNQLKYQSPKKSKQLSLVHLQDQLQDQKYKTTNQQQIINNESMQQVQRATKSIHVPQQQYSKNVSQDYLLQLYLKYHNQQQQQEKYEYMEKCLDAQKQANEENEKYGRVEKEVQQAFVIKNEGQSNNQCRNSKVNSYQGKIQNRYIGCDNQLNTNQNQYEHNNTVLSLKLKQHKQQQVLNFNQDQNENYEDYNTQQQPYQLNISNLNLIVSQYQLINHQQSNNLQYRQENLQFKTNQSQQHKQVKQQQPYDENQQNQYLFVPKNTNNLQKITSQQQIQQKLHLELLKNKQQDNRANSANELQSNSPNHKQHEETQFLSFDQGTQFFDCNMGLNSSTSFNNQSFINRTNALLSQHNYNNQDSSNIDNVKAKPINNDSPSSESKDKTVFLELKQKQSYNTILQDLNQEQCGEQVNENRTQRKKHQQKYYYNSQTGLLAENNEFEKGIVQFDDNMQGVDMQININDGSLQQYPPPNNYDYKTKSVQKQRQTSTNKLSLIKTFSSIYQQLIASYKSHYQQSLHVIQQQLFTYKQLFVQLQLNLTLMIQQQFAQRLRLRQNDIRMDIEAEYQIKLRDQLEEIQQQYIYRDGKRREELRLSIENQMKRDFMLNNYGLNHQNYQNGKSKLLYQTQVQNRSSSQQNNCSQNQNILPTELSCFQTTNNYQQKTNQSKSINPFQKPSSYRPSNFDFQQSQHRKSQIFDNFMFKNSKKAFQQQQQRQLQSLLHDLSMQNQSLCEQLVLQHQHASLLNQQQIKYKKQLQKLTDLEEELEDVKKQNIEMKKLLFEIQEEKQEIQKILQKEIKKIQQEKNLEMDYLEKELMDKNQRELGILKEYFQNIIEDLNQQIKILQKQKNSIQKEKQTNMTRQQIRHCNQEPIKTQQKTKNYEQLQIDLKQKCVQITQLNQAKIKQQQTIKSLQQQIQQLRQQCLEAKKQLVQLKKLQQQLINYKQQFKNMQGQILQLRNKNNDLQQENSKICQENIRLLHEKNSISEENIKLNDKIQEFKVEANKLKQEVFCLKSMIFVKQANPSKSIDNQNYRLDANRHPLQNSKNPDEIATNRNKVYPSEQIKSTQRQSNLNISNNTYRLSGVKQQQSSIIYELYNNSIKNNLNQIVQPHNNSIIHQSHNNAVNKILQNIKQKRQSKINSTSQLSNNSNVYQKINSLQNLYSDKFNNNNLGMPNLQGMKERNHQFLHMNSFQNSYLLNQQKKYQKDNKNKDNTQIISFRQQGNQNSYQSVHMKNNSRLINHHDLQNSQFNLRSSTSSKIMNSTQINLISPKSPSSSEIMNKKILSSEKDKKMSIISMKLEKLRSDIRDQIKEISVIKQISL